MKKSELIDRVAAKAELTKNAAQRAVEAIFDATTGAIAEAVKAGEHVSIPGFGRFKPRERAARKGRNPQTGKEISIPARKSVGFAAGKGFSDTLQGKAPSGRRAAAKKSGGSTAKKSGGSAAKKSGGSTAKKSGATARKSGGAASKSSAAKKGGAAKKSGSAAKKSNTGATKRGNTGAAKKSGSTAKKSGAAKKSGGSAAKKSTAKKT